MTPEFTVLIAGGGASGALLAAQLLRHSGNIRVVVVEPRAELGRGMAYSTTCASHLLNVPAAKMSAFPEDPRHFLGWLHARGLAEYHDASFVPRMIYGDYLGAVLDEARRDAGPGRFEHLQSRIIAYHPAHHPADGVRLRLADGSAVEGHALVLALGNAPPTPWRLSDSVILSKRFFSLMWESRALTPADPNESVLLLGTGLTAVDAVLALRDQGHRGPIMMVSRRGLLPKPHSLCALALVRPPAALLPPTATTTRQLMHELRVCCQIAERLQGDWRVAIDSLRPHTNAIWQSLSLVEQRRLLRHVRVHWDIYRHRMAPEIASTIHGLLADQTLRVVAGRVRKIEVSSRGLEVVVRHRGKDINERLDVSRVITCTGPQTDLEHTTNPLLSDLVKQGVLLPHPLRTGVLVNDEGALVQRNGEPSPTLFAMGPLRMGTLFETVAMPEIRQQASDLARLLLDEASRRATVPSIRVQVPA